MFKRITWKKCDKCKEEKPNTIFKDIVCDQCRDKCKEIAKQDIIKELPNRSIFPEDNICIEFSGPDTCTKDCVSRDSYMYLTIHFFLCFPTLYCLGLACFSCYPCRRCYRCKDCNILNLRCDFPDDKNVCNYCIDKYVSKRWKRYIDPNKTMIEDIGKNKVCGDIINHIKTFL